MVSPRFRRAIRGVCFLAINFALAVFGTTPPGSATTQPPRTTNQPPPRPAIPTPPSRTTIPPRATTATTTTTAPHSTTTTTTTPHPTTTTTKPSVGKTTHGKGAHFGSNHSASAVGIGVGAVIDVSRLFQHKSEPEPVYMSSPTSLSPNNTSRDIQANRTSESPKRLRSKTAADPLWSRVDLTSKEVAGPGWPFNKP